MEGRHPLLYQDSLTNYTISIAAVNANGTGPNTSLNLICKLLLLRRKKGLSYV